MTGSPRPLFRHFAIVSLLSLSRVGAFAQDPDVLQPPPNANAAAARPSDFFRYQRSVSVPSAGPACALLDAEIYPHAAPFLKDLRLHQTTASGVAYEIPYVLTLSEPQGVDTESARVLNLGLQGRQIVFDLVMPQRNYTDVTLDLDAHNFLATATVTSSRGAGATALGAFTLYDLSAQHLSRSTTLHLQETDSPMLHVVLSISAAPGAPALRPSAQIVRGAEVPPSREAQTIYTVSARSAAVIQRGRQTVATFRLPERVPVERVAVELAPGFAGNFSRDVHVTAHPGSGASPSPEDSEVVSGTIRRVRLTEGGREIHEGQLSIPAILGANLQQPATVEVAIDNGDDPPLPISAVVLEMRERKLCFDTRSTAGMTLLYGDPGLPAPQYDYARLFRPSATAAQAQLGPEEVIASFRPRPDLRPTTERHPRLLWIALLLSACSLGLVAFRSAKRTLR